MSDQLAAVLGTPTSDDIVHVTTWPHMRPCVYRQRIWRSVPALVVVTELADNPGMSITNAAELVYAECQRVAGPSAIVVEHYGPDSYVSGGREGSRYDHVTVDGDGTPHWRRIALAELARS
jgi:hypothetical protein